MPDTNNDMNFSHDDESKDKSFDFLEGAKKAKNSGNALLSMYLYLAAFQKSFDASSIPSESAIFGLKEAWSIACENKERSLAEYIFEILEPYLSSDEVTECAKQLQGLTFDKLEEFGLSREDLEDMAQAITDDFLGEDAAVASLESMMPGIFPENVSAHILPFPSTNEKKEDDSIVAVEPDTELVEDEQKDFFFLNDEDLNYDNIAGFDSTVRLMRDFGIGMDNDERYQQLVGMLNARHGVSSKPAPDTMLFRSQAREDAFRFISATLGELSLPSVRMHMEENFQGIPVLCVSANAVDFPKSRSLKDVFTNGGVLVLEDLDLWEPPEPMDVPEDGNPFLLMHMTRGAREAMNLISSAVENPKVFVLASASQNGVVDEFFLNILGPMTVIDIDYPNEEERKSIWMDIAKNHPSFRSINKRDLVSYSANLPRIDIYSAAREAVEEAYKIGLVTKKYRPITRENIFEKLAAYQPLDSNEYSKLEEEVVRNFQDDLNHLDDLLSE